MYIGLVLDNIREFWVRGHRVSIVVGTGSKCRPVSAIHSDSTHYICIKKERRKVTLSEELGRRITKHKKIKRGMSEQSQVKISVAEGSTLWSLSAAVTRSGVRVAGSPRRGPCGQRSEALCPEAPRAAWASRDKESNISPSADFALCFIFLDLISVWNHSSCD